MEFDYCWKTHLPTFIGSSIVRDLPMDSVHLQAFGGLTLSRLLGKINTGRVTVNHPVIGLLVCGNDYANGMDRDSISTLYQEVIDAIQTTQPDTHIIVFAIPPRNFDVKTSDIILLNHTLSQIPHKTQNVTYSKATYSTFIYANQVKIDDFNKQDKYPLLHPTPKAKTRLGSIIQSTIAQKLIDLHHKPPKLINSTKHPLSLHRLDCQTLSVWKLSSSYTTPPSYTHTQWRKPSISMTGRLPAT